VNNLFKKGYYRPSYSPSENIPFGARSVGHYIVQPPHLETPCKKHFVQIFWGIRGTGAMIIDGIEKKLEPKKIAIYFPGMVHNIYALNEEWEYRWWTMDGPLATAVTTGFGLAASDIYDAGEAPVKIFKELEKAVTDNTPDGERFASAIAYKLLTYAACSHHSDESQDLKIKEAVNIINNEWSNPMLGIEILADRINMDRSVFSKRFHRAMGIAPVKYIISLRVQNALSQLKYGRDNISGIARKCGWRDPNYFSRCIRKASGQSPEDFREN
jgi:AraC-like DNA-binding protein